MSSTITFDTHFHAKNLKKAGFNDDQIEAQLALAQAQTDFIDNNLATKNDIALVHKDIKTIEERIANIDKSIINLDKSQNKWGWILVFISSLIALLVTFHH